MPGAKTPTPPGTVIRRFRPKFHYELLTCGFRGHVLVGTDAAEVRPDDDAFVREFAGMRWYRCLRCDAWLPLPPPKKSKRQYVPDKDEVELPMRGRALRDKIVLRIIAVDRAIHFVVLGTLAVLAFVLASHRAKIDNLINRLNSFFFGTNTGKRPPAHGFVHETERLLTLDVNTLRLIGIAAAAYAILEGAEAYGLWLQRRWAEYLTFIATTLFVPYEIYELTEKITVIRVGAFVLNMAILVYLLFAKRLFGLRGGGEAEHRAREADSGWAVFDQLTPGGFAE
ncbi:MAG TPA: DUF2127 domain-containing protein [Gaiellaceae bacterium]|nr:DUF2127 domain-containing protein [Gaiellaceae bacterium]